jgi:2-phospho-L-lactate guanylyltransferase (CobY/MobA/RfbA family)
VSIWAIVPLKPFRQAKSRLASALGDEERLALSREMLRTVLSALAEVPRIDRTLLVSRDTEALSLGRQLGAKTLAERPRSLQPGSLRRQRPPSGRRVRPFGVAGGPSARDFGGHRGPD